MLDRWKYQDESAQVGQRLGVAAVALVCVFDERGLNLVKLRREHQVPISVIVIERPRPIQLDNTQRLTCVKLNVAVRRAQPVRAQVLRWQVRQELQAGGQKPVREAVVFELDAVVVDAPPDAGATSVISVDRYDPRGSVAPEQLVRPTRCRCTRQGSPRGPHHARKSITEP